MGNRKEPAGFFASGFGDVDGIQRVSDVKLKLLRVEFDHRHRLNQFRNAWRVLHVATAVTKRFQLHAEPTFDLMVSCSSRPIPRRSYSGSMKSA